MALFYFYAWNASMFSAPEAATDHLANMKNEGAEKGRGTIRETEQGRLAAWVYKQLLYDALFSLGSIVDTFSLKRQIFTSLIRNAINMIWLIIICFEEKNVSGKEWNLYFAEINPDLASRIQSL